MNQSRRKVVVLGLGYVGLPLTCLSSHHFDVIGVDINQEKINAINKGICPLDDIYTKQVFANANFKATTNLNILKQADIIVVCVPTPVDEKHQPNLKPLTSAVQSIADNLQKNQLLIIESTIYPGTTEEVILPILEQTNLKVNEDFLVAYCPERIDPGNQKWFLENIPRVLGSLNEQGAQKAREFYKSFISAEIKVLNSIKAAEAVKIMENTFRDINIAFINEMAKSFDKLGIDISEVIKGASTKPFGFMPFYPGPGVGGHCIPIDPYYLIEKAKIIGFDHQFLNLARTINSSMPYYVVDITQEELNKLDKSINNAKIGVLGYTYKKGIDDPRESPAAIIINLLKKKGALVLVYDPYLLKKSDVNNLNDILNDVDYLILATNHDEFVNMDLDLLKEKEIKLVIDGRNCLDKKKIKELGIAYHGIGRK